MVLVECQGERQLLETAASEKLLFVMIHYKLGNKLCLTDITDLSITLYTSISSAFTLFVRVFHPKNFKTLGNSYMTDRCPFVIDFWSNEKLETQ